MKNFSKIISIVLVLVLLVSSLVTTNSISFSAQTVDINATASEYGLADTVQNGVILHAWNVSLKNIKSALPDIAAAGYTTVQTSPIQQPKDYNQSWTDVAGQWWKLYQPLSLGSIATSSWIGTKPDLTDLCTEADKYGIKIICDIVFNHMANDGNSDSGVNSGIKNYESYIYNNKTTTFHSYYDCYDSSTVNVVRGNIGMPDLNTSDATVQERATNLLKECIDCGVDGFRFDAAKHIETPSDGSYASDFWPNVLNAATSYAQTNKGITPYYYGEILNTAGDTRSYSYYSPYMSVTDNTTGNNIMWNIHNNNASNAATNFYNSGLSADKVVLWAESHDTYADDSTSSVSQTDINKAYCLDASRNKASSLYLIRTNGAQMGTIGSTSYKSSAVVAANKFHNYFIGSSEYLSSSDKYVINERYNNIQTGIVIVNCSGTSSTLSNININKMTNGTYTDKVSGNQFVVSNGKISGQIGDTGVAVIYDDDGSYVPPTENPDAGYYLVGTLNGKNCWPPTNGISNDRKFTLNTKCTEAEEYILNFDLKTDDEIKVVYYDGTSYTWFPDGSDNYIVPNKYSGNTNIYFRPNGNSSNSWVANGYLYIDLIEPDATSATSSTSSSTTETIIETDPIEYGTKRIYVGIISYLINSSITPTIHYWNTAGLEGDSEITLSSDTQKFAVGASYWSNTEKTFTIGYVDIPENATAFKSYANISTYNNSGWSDSSINISDITDNIVCIFEYSNTLHNVLETYIYPTEELTEESTSEPTEEPTLEPTEEPTEEPTSEPTEEPTLEPTETSTSETIVQSLKDGYYLIGTFNKIKYDISNIDPNTKLYVNTDNKTEEEYIIYKYLYPGDTMRVVKVENNSIVKYYKESTEYIVSANFRNKKGYYKILFRPNGNLYWLYTYISATRINSNTPPEYPEQPTELETEIPTEASTEVVTEVSTEEPMETVETNNIYIYGDVDLDKSISIIDVTIIQQTLASINILSSIQTKCAMISGLDHISISDATLIQKYLSSGYSEDELIGKSFT